MGTRERDGLCVRLRNGEEELAAVGGGCERSENALGAGAVIGNERTDLAAVSGRADHAEAAQLAVAEDRAADVARCLDPGPQKRCPRRRKHISLDNGT